MKLKSQLTIKEVEDFINNYNKEKTKEEIEWVECKIRGLVISKKRGHINISIVAPCVFKNVKIYKASIKYVEKNPTVTIADVANFIRDWSPEPEETWVYEGLGCWSSNEIKRIYVESNGKFRLYNEHGSTLLFDSLEEAKSG
jgi:hypothetical protein